MEAGALRSTGLHEVRTPTPGFPLNLYRLHKQDPMVLTAECSPASHYLRKSKVSSWSTARAATPVRIYSQPCCLRQSATQRTHKVNLVEPISLTPHAIMEEGKECANAPVAPRSPVSAPSRNNGLNTCRRCPSSSLPSLFSTSHLWRPAPSTQFCLPGNADNVVSCTGREVQTHRLPSPRTA